MSPPGNGAATPPHCACANRRFPQGPREPAGHRRAGRGGSRGISRLRKGRDRRGLEALRACAKGTTGGGGGLDALRACAKGARASRVVPFETSGGELLPKPLASLSAGWKRVPSSVGLAMALQLSREQGITLRGSAEIVAEFCCKSSSRGAEGGESRAQATRRPAARPERPRIPALVPRPPVPAGGLRKWGGGRRLRSCCCRRRRRPGRCRGPPCGEPLCGSVSFQCRAPPTPPAPNGEGPRGWTVTG